MKSDTKQLKKNVILNIIYKMSSILFPILVYPYVTRILLAENMGKVSFFTSLTSYALMLGSLGISTYGIREVAKVRDDKKKLSILVKELLGINAVVTIMVVIVLIGSTFFVSKLKSNIIILLASCIQILLAPFGMEWFFNGIEDYAYIAKRAISLKLISLVLIFSLVREKEDYILYAVITIGSFIASYMLNFLYSTRFIDYKVKTKFVFKKHVKSTLILFASILAINIYTNVDTVMLGFLNGDRAVGLYDVAVKGKTVLLALINAISAALYPRLTYYVEKKDIQRYNKVLAKSLEIIFGLALAMAFFFIINADIIVMFLGGEEYKESILCMRILMPILVISGMSNITGNQILLPNGKEICYMKAVIIGACVDVVLNMIMMPKYSLYGAAVATLMAEIFQMSYQIYRSKEYLKMAINYVELIKMSLATIISSVVIVFFKDLIFGNLFLRLIITFVVYVSIYLLVAKIIKIRALNGLINRRMTGFARKY